MKIHTFACVAVMMLACADPDHPAVLEDGASVRFLRVVDPYVTCFETSAAENRIFRTQAGWEAFWATAVQCVNGEDPVPAPVFDFDRHTLLMTLHEGECAYSGCYEEIPLITHVTVRDGRLTVGTREARPEELSTCLACVQPRDLVLVDAALVERYEVEFLPRRPAESACTALPSQ